MRVNLLKRWVLVSFRTISCPFCSALIDSSSHLFVTYKVASSVRIFRWLGWCVVFPRDILTLFQLFIALSGGSSSRGGLGIIWHVVVWSIWKTRNVIVFSILRWHLKIWKTWESFSLWNGILVGLWKNVVPYQYGLRTIFCFWANCGMSGFGLPRMCSYCVFLASLLIHVSLD